MTTATIDELFAAIQSAEVQRVGAIIAENPAILSQRNTRGISPLSWAAYTGQASLIELLRTKRGTPDFFEACIVGDEETVRAAIAAGQDLNAFAPDGFTPVALAVFFGNSTIAKQLIEAGADVNLRAKNAQGVGPIHAAVARGDNQALELLLLRGADPNATQEKGHRPMHEAAASGNTAAVALLLMFGADPAPKNHEGRTPADMARAKGHALAARLEAIASTQSNADVL